jgi:hypothetical protein
MKIFYYDLRRVQHTGGSTIAAARAALVEGIGVSLGGGTHMPVLIMDKGIVGTTIRP